MIMGSMEKHSEQQLVQEEFSHHDQTIARINNGSFGSCPASIISAQHQWQLRFLQQPDDFYFNHPQPGLLQSRTAIKNLINAAFLEEVAIIDNVTTAAAIVLQHISWGFVQGKYHRGDTVFMLRYTYGAVKKLIHAYISRMGGNVIEAAVPFPEQSNEQIVMAFRQALGKAKEIGNKVILAVIDHISSMPSVLLPLKELVRICREEMVEQVFVDGAHAIELHHLVVSHEYGHGLGVESSWVGTRDYSAQLVIPEVLDFVNRFEGGLEGVQRRNHDKVVEIGEMLSQAWGTKLGSPPEMCASMIMVGLPSSLEISTETDAFNLRTHLWVMFGIEVHIYWQAIKCGVQTSDDCSTAYARISHHVYNTNHDYYRFRDAIIQLCQQGRTCRMLPHIK
ncbi:hypothetical protein IFM89_015333 [Coptis chinensis]|uniref:Uncharacterized protein n=1 Tax=Coptis chinensis TaxID=261450 RepID=A0A835MEL4_9MAGN|nr:hypothetical protein IFM89_015333 [Coptis chinensis]